MSALDELIYDRTQTDVTYAAELNRKLGRGEAFTAQELADWNVGLKGAYNAADMNRVDAAVRELGGMLTAAGYPVKYVDPHQAEPKPPGGIEITLTSDDLQAGAYLYTTGEFRAGYANYVCTKSKIKLTTGKSIVVRTDLTLLQYSGFVWYDANKNFIANTFPSSSQGEAPIQWNGNFQAIPPENAVYCDIDINATGITPESAGTIYVRQESDPENAPLPDDYQRVEYIESDGTQDINSGVSPASTLTLDISFEPMDTDLSNKAVFGSTWAYNGFFLCWVSGQLRFLSGGTSVDMPVPEPYMVHNAHCAYNMAELDGSIYNLSVSQDNTTTAISIFDTGDNVAEQYGYRAKMKLYSCQIKDIDILVRYYIPCTDPSGKAGLYDAVSGSFFGNANASSVEPVDLPSGYTQVEYIQSSGTQYINTGYKPNQDSRVVLDFEMTDTSTYTQGLFGSRNESPATASRAFDVWISGNTNIRTNYFGLDTTLTNIPLQGNRYIIDKNKNVVTIAGQTYTFASRSGQCPMDMYLLALNQGMAGYIAYCKVYSCVVYDSNTVVRNFIPCRNSSGAVGLYDIANSQFYSNAGSGTFSAGAEVSPGFEPGMPVPEPTPPDENVWQIGDVVKQSEWAQYIANVQSLRDAYYAMVNSPALPDPTAPLTYDGANAIEKLIYDILMLYEGMVYRYRICGTFTAGNDYNRQYIRSV